MLWVDYIISAFKDLGGYATYEDLYAKLLEIRKEPFTDAWKATVRRTIEDHASQSANFRGNDLFYLVGEKGHGIWGLRNYFLFTPPAKDISTPEQNISQLKSPAERKEQIIYRILRDTEIARFVKRLYDFRCQICSYSLKLNDGSFYAEAHHIKPLGSPHNGPDISSNILCLCPNHHVQLDYGVIQIEKSNLELHLNHSLDDEFIEYHNLKLFK